MVFNDKMHDIINVLESDGVILYPTDTVWGLGCSAKSIKAINKIKTIKKIDLQEPLIILTSSLSMTKKYTYQIHPRVETLLDYHQKPLTVVYPKAKNLPNILIKDDNTIAMRRTLDPFCKTIVELLGHPIVSTMPISCAKGRPLNYADIPREIIQQVDYTCLHRRNILSDTLPSPVVKYNKKGELFFLRD